MNREGDEIECRTNLLISAFEGIRELLDIDRPGNRQGIEVSQFSDAVVISFNADRESGVFYALLDILYVQINLVFKGLLCRGGVTRGPLVHTPKMLFGPGMVDAYSLESKAAVYPRVILNQSIIGTGIEAHGQHHLRKHEEEGIMSLLEKDSDGMYYIDYVTRAQYELDDPEIDDPLYLTRLQKLVADGLTSEDPSIFVKYQWISERLRPHIQSKKEYAQKSLAKGCELRDSYESIPDL